MLSLALLFVLALSCLALWLSRSGKRELVYVLFVHLFVYFARVNFCPFSLPLGVSDRLWFVIVALPRVFHETINFLVGRISQKSLKIKI